LRVDSGYEDAKCRIFPSVQKADVKSSALVKRDPGFGNIPLYFIPNQGQVDETVKFYAKTPAYTLWMTKEGLVFDSVKKVEDKEKIEERHPSLDKHTPPSDNPLKTATRNYPTHPTQLTQLTQLKQSGCFKTHFRVLTKIMRWYPLI